MKTLKTLIIVSLLSVTTLLANANEEHEVPTLKASTVEELKTSIEDVIKNDFNHYNNFFYQKGINKFQENVVVKFRIMPNKKLYMYSVECEDCDGAEYVKEMLKNVTFDVDENLMKRNYALNIKLDYRT
ncbi:MAG: hypothetical protein K9G70_14500 [Prolixibacteraceae bacterium]|nr:hypothetical protein [Prolixibacteraceae bacterium]